MSLLIFKASDVLRVVEHSIAAPEQGQMLVGFDIKTGNGTFEPVKAPAVLLVHDDGVYLMSNGQPRDIVSGPTSYTAHAKGCDPKTDEGWYETSSALVGGDDFAETLPWALRIKQQIDDGAKYITIKVGANSLELIEPRRAVSKAKVKS